MNTKSSEFSFNASLVLVLDGAEFVTGAMNRSYICTDALPIRELNFMPMPSLSCICLVVYAGAESRPLRVKRMHVCLQRFLSRETRSMHCNALNGSLQRFPPEEIFRVQLRAGDAIPEKESSSSTCTEETKVACL